MLTFVGMEQLKQHYVYFRFNATDRPQLINWNQDTDTFIGTASIAPPLNIGTGLSGKILPSGMNMERLGFRSEDVLENDAVKNILSLVALLDHYKESVRTTAAQQLFQFAAILDPRLQEKGAPELQKVLAVLKASHHGKPLYIYIKYLTSKIIILQSASCFILLEALLRVLR